MHMAEDIVMELLRHVEVFRVRSSPVMNKAIVSANRLYKTFLEGMDIRVETNGLSFLNYLRS